MARPFISIVVPTYNASKFLPAFFRTLTATRYRPFEVIVCDDGSKDGTLEFIEGLCKRRKNFRLLKNAKKLGIAGSRNRALRYARGHYIGLIETDMEVEPNWLTPLVEALEHDRSLGAVTGKVLDLENRSRIHAVGAWLIPHTGWAIARGFGEPDQGQYDEPTEVTAGAVGTLVRAEVMRALGGFDAALDRNVEDLDLGWRIWLAGWRIRTVPRSRTYHRSAKPPSERTENISLLEHDFHNQKILRLLIKNYQAANLLRYLPQALLILLARVLLNLLRGNPIPTRAFLRAMWWTLATLPATLRERRKVQKIRRFSDREILKRIGCPGSFWLIWRRDLLPLFERARSRSST